MEMVFATHNQNKLREVQKLLPEGITLLSLKDIGCLKDIPETADTLEGNAKLKADYVTKNYQLPCFADDTGLLVNALNGKPGVYSARYAGENNDANANMDKLLLHLNPHKNRTAHFSTIIALNLTNKEETIFFNGSVQGHISKEKRGTLGFGYDPIFVPEGYNETFAELSIEIKNKISHRGKAFIKLIHHLKYIHVTE